MTKQEVKEIIKTKAIKYGIELDEDLKGTINRHAEYICIQLFESLNHEKTEWGKKAHIDLEFSASICRMGGSPSTDELLKAADEIRIGALFTAELQSMNLYYEKTF